MRLFLALLLLGSTLNSYAYDCFKELCVDDVVRDQFGWKGSVESFDRENDQVIVALHHIPSSWPFEYKELGKQVFCHQEFCQGQELIDQYGHAIVIEEVYTHGMISAFNFGIDGYALYSFQELRQ